jgi:hypothetical protein
LPAAVDRKDWMRQMRTASQAGSIRRAPNRVNRLVFEKKQLIFKRRVLPFFCGEFFLQCERLCEVYSS